MASVSSPCPLCDCGDCVDWGCGLPGFLLEMDSVATRACACCCCCCCGVAPLISFSRNFSAKNQSERCVAVKTVNDVVDKTVNDVVDKTDMMLWTRQT